MEELKNILKQSTTSANDEALAKNECPECGWKLKVNKEGQKACQFCEKVY